jgi:hypothetical protein
MSATVRLMTTKLPHSALVLFIALATVGLTACGGGSSSSTSSASTTNAGNTTASSGNTNSSSSGGTETGGAVVATVDNVPITKAAVNHWMGTLAGGDYYQLSAGNTVPEGLASEPANYSKCVANLEAAVASSPVKSTTVTGAVLLKKCRELYQALRAQAVAFLIKAQWLVGSYREVGVTVNEAELTAFFKRFQAENYPTESALHEYLAKRRLTLSDEMLLLKLDLLSQKGLQKINAGGQKTYAKILAAEQRWNEKATCSPGYVVEHCKEHKGGGTSYGSGPAPAVLMEQVAALATGRCTNLAACAKQ